MSKVIPLENHQPKNVSRPLTDEETAIIFSKYPELEQLIGTEYRLEWDERTKSPWVVGEEVFLTIGLFLAISRMAQNIETLEDEEL